MKGLIHIYTGNGKGKTSAAIGLGIRAYGCGLKILMLQFLKGRISGEELLLNRLSPEFELVKLKSTDKFSWELNTAEKEELKNSCKQILEYAYNNSANRDVLILDEIMAAINNGFIEIDTILKFVKNKPEHLELIMTGRNAPPELIELADYVSEINEVKHPMKLGIKARKGIEF